MAESHDSEGFPLVEGSVLRRQMFDGDRMLKHFSTENLRSDTFVVRKPDGSLYLRWEA